MNIRKIGPSLLVIGLLVFSGLAILPATVTRAEQGQPDLVVKNIGWVFPVKEGEELPVTVYVENVGDADVDDAFWLEVEYSDTFGFWQEPTERFDIWVEPPIKAGEIKGVEFTTTALETHQVDFEAFLDTTEVITESNEENNKGHLGVLSIEVPPGTTATGSVHVRNEGLTSDTFTIEADESTLPEGWELSGGIPPTQVTAQPGENVALSETLIVPEDTIMNPAIRFNATRQSDGEEQEVYLQVQTTPEMGFSFNPYIDEFSVWVVDSADTEVSITSEIISEFGPISVTEYTATNTNGNYLGVTVNRIKTRHLNMYEITELDYNGEITITPDDNRFITTFNVKNDELKHYHQKMISNPETAFNTRFNIRDELTTIEGTLNGERVTLTLDDFHGLGARITNGQIYPLRLDTRDTTTPCCTNQLCITGALCRLVYT
ncbi:MAG: CARDB domain-containing protein [Thermoplasmata archaeon]